MSLGLIVSSIALGVSLTASAVKLVDWLIHADPRAIARIGRSLLFFLVLASIPCLVVLLIQQQWALAMALGAGMLIAPTLRGWRAILPRPKVRRFWTRDSPLDGPRGDFGSPAPSPEFARRAAIVLEDYLMHVGYPETGPRIDSRRRRVERETPPSGQDEAMSAEEALDILGLEPSATAGAIRAAHLRLLRLVHPDRGGTTYLAAQINRAKETLLDESAWKPSPAKDAGSNDE